ncbi:unnamed protein product (macronuclear) [Paramecium tetraurelia]|uniref:Transmembrane protein n=1 Tax=Paramecium tetraurelia TaxID=5888 RepID=A0D4I2_PARTE|nr:uncharacterized protein GSPATT00013415001 [Paramecium tetraurelia]CAK77949.1 unnamed protein product [Paramecium tetraurelia]|eukprot:XP_001445346.1 hypothetical protein (macronuclear) [Paramecium tetraurelia strain d4-2]
MGQNQLLQLKRCPFFSKQPISFFPLQKKKDWFLSFIKSSTLLTPVNQLLVVMFKLILFLVNQQRDYPTLENKFQFQMIKQPLLIHQFYFFCLKQVEIRQETIFTYIIFNLLICNQIQ